MNGVHGSNARHTAHQRWDAQNEMRFEIQQRYEMMWRGDGTQSVIVSGMERWTGYRTAISTVH